MKITKGAVVANQRIKASTSGSRFPYNLISAYVVLRDWADIGDGDYVDNEHRMLVDIADSLYNADVRVDNMTKQYQDLYSQYGKQYFDRVLDDIAALDSQVTLSNVNYLIADVNDMLEAY